MTKTFKKKKAPYIALVRNKGTEQLRSAPWRPPPAPTFRAKKITPSRRSPACGTVRQRVCWRFLRLVCAEDMKQSSAVTMAKHKMFAEENDMYRYAMSAKTGDSVNTCFHRVAADLAGILLSKAEIEVGAHWCAV